jgi:hypothetical protein
MHQIRGVGDQVVKFVYLQLLVPDPCGFESRQGLLVNSFEEGYGTSLTPFTRQLVSAILYEGALRIIKSLLMLEKCHMT